MCVCSCFSFLSGSMGWSVIFDCAFPGHSYSFRGKFDYKALKVNIQL